MRLSNPHQFLRFNPPKIQSETPEVVQDFLNRPAETEFVMADVIRVKTKVADFERRSMNEQIEAQVLERLKDVQEAAYTEGYNVGRADGHNAAYQENATNIVKQMESFEQMIASIVKIKQEILLANEAQFIKFTMFLAERLAYHEVQTNPEALQALVARLVEMAQGEEKITVSIAPAQMEFFEKMKLNTNRTSAIDDFKNVVFEADPAVTPGGCIVQTNYSEIDARIEERVKMLWELMSDQLFKIPDKLTA